MLNMSKKSWTGLVTALAFAAFVPGCTTGETEESPTPTAQTLTFKVDVNTKADGTNNLNEVKSGESVYVVGNFTGWNPNNETFKMTDEGGGVWSLTLTLPFAGADYDGNEFLVQDGAALEYKFAKTASDSADAWSEGPKDYFATTEKACPNDNGSGGGLWEVANLTYTVTADTAVLDTFMAEAWRETAEAKGYPSCN